MIRAFAARLIALVGVLLFLSALVFALQRVIPGDPVRLMVGSRASEEVVKAQRKALGFDKPLIAQYLDYIAGVVRGDLKMSLHTRRPVIEDLTDFLPATVELIIVSFLLAVMLGVAIGLGSVSQLRGFWLIRSLAFLGAAMPVFLLAMVGLLVLYGQLGWIPAAGRTSFSDFIVGPTGFLIFDSVYQGRFDVLGDVLHHLIFPALCLALFPGVAIGRVFRGSLGKTLLENHVRTARSKGISERKVLFRHAARNSLGPTLSVAGVQVAILFGNVVIVESIFAWPGIGRYTAQSIAQNDFPAIAGVTIVLGALYVGINSLVDLLQLVADPRLRS